MSPAHESVVVHLPGGRTVAAPYTPYTTAETVLGHVLDSVPSLNSSATAASPTSTPATGAGAGAWRDGYVLTEVLGDIVRFIPPHTVLSTVLSRWSALLGAPSLRVTPLPESPLRSSSDGSPAHTALRAYHALDQVTCGALALDATAASVLGGLLLAISWGGPPSKVQERAFEAGRLSDLLPMAVVDVHMPGVWRALLREEASKWLDLEVGSMVDALAAQMAHIPGANTLWLAPCKCAQWSRSDVRVGVGPESVRVHAADDGALLLAVAHTKIKRWAVGHGSLALEVHHLSSVYQFVFETAQATLFDAALLHCVQEGVAAREGLSLRAAQAQAQAQADASAKALFQGDGSGSDAATAAAAATAQPRPGSAKKPPRPKSGARKRVVRKKGTKRGKGPRKSASRRSSPLSSRASSPLSQSSPKPKRADAKTGVKARSGGRRGGRRGGRPGARTSTQNKSKTKTKPGTTSAGTTKPKPKKTKVVRKKVVVRRRKKVVA